MDGGEDVSAALNQEILQYWEDVIRTVDKLLKGHAVLGFQMIGTRLNPSLKEISFGLSLVDNTLDLLMTSDLMHPDEIRMALNAKQCILLVRMLVNAVETNDESAYSRAIEMLKNQPKI